ncbi:hypothetical protein QFZ70_002620 [Arthrobacter sp. V1I9]|uniref:hypothetical protein n=1 Tax=Arthrobacter sp. V1I9 TaxID=3042275 RepID=UPI002794FB4B|nr:hypothetical protein [Arthrobacter sp. V1I9]MDQ0870147.1 hypothetical protein [Arthrobacter sp. V1I9]
MRHVKGMVQQLLNGEKSADGVSSFQAQRFLLGTSSNRMIPGITGATFWESYKTVQREKESARS